MKSIENIRVAKKPALVLVATIIVGFGLGLLPKELEALSRIGHVLAMFAAGILVAPQLAIWESAKDSEHAEHQEPPL